MNTFPLVFHDCVSPKCDGCINLGLADNAGLEEVVERMEEIYRPGGEDGEISDAMTRADFW